MKAFARLPFVLLLLIACLLVVLAALQLAATWGMEVSGGEPFTLTWILGTLPGAAFEVSIPAVVLAIALLGFWMAGKGLSRTLGFLLVLAVGYIVLGNGMLWLHRAQGAARQTDLAPGLYMRPLAFVRLGGAYVNPTSMAGNRLEGVLVAEPSKPAPRLSVHSSGLLQAKGDEVSLSLDGRPPAELRQRLAPAAAPLFQPDPATEILLGDIKSMTADFERLLGRSLPRFFAACFSLVFLAAASLVFLRLTRWPLANVLLLILALRLYFLLYRVLAQDLAPAVARAVTDPLIASVAPSATFVALGALLLLVDVLFVPRRLAAAEPAT